MKSILKSTSYDPANQYSDGKIAKNFFVPDPDSRVLAKRRKHVKSTLLWANSAESESEDVQSPQN